MTGSSEQHNALPAGYTFEGYRIEKVLGVGGFGITYRAVETSIDRRVAIKEYLPHGIAMRGKDEVSIHPVSDGHAEDFLWGLDRFRQEAQTLVAFQHPNIVRVYRFFEASGTAYMVMEFQEGENLAQILKREKTLGEAAIRKLLDALLDGLKNVHAQGFLHRDIKPDNIYLRADGSPVLLDFGSARQALNARSQSLTAIVTRGYAPFEQYLTSSEQGPWTDIYALAATAYQMVTGMPPPESLERVKLDEMVSATDAGRGQYKNNLLAAIDAGLRVSAEDRPQSIVDWRAMLDGGDTNFPRRARRSGRATPWLVGGAIAVLLVLAVGGILSWTAYQDREDKVIAREEDESAAEAEARRRAEEDTRIREETRKAVEDAMRAAEERRKAEEADRKRAEEEARQQAETEARAKAEEEARQRIEEDARKKAEQEAARKRETETIARETEQTGQKADLSGPNWVKSPKGCAAWINRPQPGAFYAISWSGNCVNGMIHGEGVLQWYRNNKARSRFEGSFRAGKRHGTGIARYGDGRVYEGEFRNGRHHGQGVMIWKDGTRFEGEFRKGKEWNGTRTYPDGRQQRFVNGQ